MKKVTTHDCSITGIIIANAWDRNGKVTGVAVYDNNEKIYLITKKTFIQDLLSAVQKRVRIIGKIIKMANGRRKIDVKSFKVIEHTDHRN